jgi:hypothetical protein
MPQDHRDRRAGPWRQLLIGRPLIMQRFVPVSMTIALLIALAGSLALMAYIVKRLERA